MMQERQIRVIPGRNAPEFRQHDQKRACAYVRVSTGHSAQMHSLQNQTEYYERKIKGDPRYAFRGIYSDAGISGSREDRPGFMAMMEAPRVGLVDVILTKSISRFARNTELLLRSVRELRSLGVGVMFEEQRIDTLSTEGELLLTILASIVEEERRSVSKNIQWSIRTGYRKGKPSNAIQRLYGFRKGEDGRIEIDPAQAEVIKRIYGLYLAGETPNYIASGLNEEEVPRDTDQPWSGQYLRRILRNERYTGDCLLQKSFVADTGRQVRNKGEMDKYYVREHHPAIISRGDWEEAQRLRKARMTKRYPLSGLLKCARCGAGLIRVVAEKKWVSWVCATYLHHRKAACAGTSLPDHIAQAFHEMNPITEPMIVQEADDARSARKRTAEHYHFSPISSYARS